MTEKYVPSNVAEALANNERVSRLGEFLVQLQAYQLGDREDVEFPVEGTTLKVSTIPEMEEVRAMEKEVRQKLTELCGGDESLALDVRDRFLFRFFDERGLWPNDEDK